MSSRFLILARKFAAALDASDYETARPMLAANCVYLVSDATTIVGPDAIIEHFQCADASMRQRFDEADYGSFVQLTGPASAVVDFLDRIRRGTVWHEYRYREYLQFADAGLIESIVHEDIPGENETLRKFEDVSGGTPK